MSSSFPLPGRHQARGSLCPLRARGLQARGEQRSSSKKDFNLIIFYLEQQICSINQIPAPHFDQVTCRLRSPKPPPSRSPMNIPGRRFHRASDHSPLLGDLVQINELNGIGFFQVNLKRIKHILWLWRICTNKILTQILPNRISKFQT
jgi:hypothetical protein